MGLDDTIFITFDIDWACDEVLEDTLGIIESENIQSTFFVTHDTKVLKRMKSNPKVEMGIHPNFNHLLNSQGTENATNANDIVSNLKTLVQDAVSVRSHSLTQSTNIMEIFLEYGFTHDVNLHIPYYCDMELRPFYHINGIIRVPYFWEDDTHCLAIERGYSKDYNVESLLNYSGIKIFNFHPMHVFLNTEKLERYEYSRKHFNNMKELEKLCCRNCYGTRDFLIELIHSAKKKGYSFGLIREVKI